jgi:hypothetical protein
MLVEAQKITVIQINNGSQYLQNRPNTAQKNNRRRPNATAKDQNSLRLQILPGNVK